MICFIVKLIIILIKIITNINQIARDLNERRSTNGFFNNSNLTKEEKKQILNTIAKLEIEVLNFIKNNL